MSAAARPPEGGDRVPLGGTRAAEDAPANAAAAPATAPNRPHVVKDAKGKRPEFYEAPGLDQAMSMIMVLAGELAVLHDRLDSAERVMAAHGVDLANGIETLALDQPALEAREAWRQDFLDRLFYLMRKDAAEAARAETAAAYRQAIEDIASG